MQLSGYMVFDGIPVTWSTEDGVAFSFTVKSEEKVTKAQQSQIMNIVSMDYVSVCRGNHEVPKRHRC